MLSRGERRRIDTTLLRPRGWEGVAVALEEGIRLFAGAVPTDGTTSRAQDLADRFIDGWRRVGMPPSSLSEVTVTPACGLAGDSPVAARSIQRVARDVARELEERHGD